MIFENEYDYIIPLGFNCNSANACKIAGVRKTKLPFDWMQTNALNENEQILSYFKMINDMYNNCLQFNIIKHKTNEFSILNYKAWIPHESGDCDCEGIAKKYLKYFERLKKIFESNSKILIVISQFYSLKFKNKLVKVMENYLKKLYPNNNYYFLTININNNYINTHKQLNLIIKKNPCYVNEVWRDEYLEEFTNICKNIKLKE